MGFSEAFWQSLPSAVAWLLIVAMKAAILKLGGEHFLVAPRWAGLVWPRARGRGIGLLAAMVGLLGLWGCSGSEHGLVDRGDGDGFAAGV